MSSYPTSPATGNVLRSTFFAFLMLINFGITLWFLALIAVEAVRSPLPVQSQTQARVKEVTPSLPIRPVMTLVGVD
ncbi:MAG TPA: hypothetical protein PKE63_12970 [Lacibacter sp.]|nr:hypothetical protein [Lacibacter sp.]HMO89238.1 hypothetical protein [Lacibacter sp.]HMP88184.1 hypothetical protein [Lacibacter sp.]